jgi:hypothetical protein
VSVASLGCAPALEESDLARGTRTVPDVLRGDEGPVTLTYLGVGGWLLDTGRSRLLTAPLFSNPSLLRTGFRTIATDTAAVDAALARFDVTPLDDVVAILVGHAHYDHLMDVPYVAMRHAPAARILGNTTVRHTLAAFATAGLDTVRVEDVSAAAATVEGGGRWITLAPDLRVLPLVSDHAPHFQGVTLYTGDRTRPLPEPPRAAPGWIEGETLAFVIDVLDRRGDVRLRLYYQDAVARPPFGLMPDTLAPADVAVVVPATYAEVDWHPEAVVENTGARHVLLGHWEDFFRPAAAEPEPVPFTLLKDFVARLRRALDGDDGRWSLPVPGARFVFR